MNGVLFRTALVILLSIDIGYSFIQYYNTPLDGDMAGGIVPADDVQQILDSPFGLKVFTEDILYPNPNRFFSHWAFYEYFNHVPIWMQGFADPIDSVYLAAATVKILVQLILILLLAWMVVGRLQPLKTEFLVAALLITSLFQSNGYHHSYMGIIDPSITYAFFYSMPMVFVVIYFIPLFLRELHGIRWRGGGVGTGFGGGCGFLWRRFAA